jgi:hypothetical protein
LEAAGIEAADEGKDAASGLGAVAAILEHLAQGACSITWQLDT